MDREREAPPEDSSDLPTLNTHSELPRGSQMSKTGNHCPGDGQDSELYMGWIAKQKGQMQRVLLSLNMNLNF